MEFLGFVGFWIWLGSFIGAVIVGDRKNAIIAGLLLGLCFGPVGLLAAFGLDARAQCPACKGRLDGYGDLCQHCRTPLFWNAKKSDFSEWKEATIVPASKSPEPSTPQAKPQAQRQKVYDLKT